MSPQECKIARCTKNQIEMRPISLALVSTARPIQGPVWSFTRLKGSSAKSGLSPTIIGVLGTLNQK